MLRERLNEALKTAMKGRDQRAVSTVRLILATIKERDIAARSKGNTEGIPDGEILAAMQGMIKQREESMRLYEQGNRPELVQQEREEIGVIERFLPQSLGEAEVAAAIEAAIAEVGAKEMRDMGKVVGVLRGRYAGQMDFAKVSAQIKARLGG